MEKEKLWYENGMLPIGISELSRYDGARSYKGVSRLFENISYIKRVGFDNSPIIFLTEKNIGHFFRNNETEDFLKLKEKINKNGFNIHLNYPFDFFSVSDLVASDLTTERIALSGARESKSDTVKAGHTKAYLINKTNAHHFVTRGGGSKGNLDRLRKMIDESYNEFKNWVPQR